MCAACLNSLFVDGRSVEGCHGMVKSRLLAGEAAQGSFGTQNWELPKDLAGVLLQPGHLGCWPSGDDCCLTRAKAAAVHVLLVGLSTGTQMQQAAG